MTREEQILRHARGIGLTWVGDPPAEVIRLWEAGFLIRDNEMPYTYKSRDGVMIEEPEEE